MSLCNPCFLWRGGVVRAYTVEDAIPTGWPVSTISHGGVETSTDLARWLPLAEVTASPDGTALPLNNRPEEPQRFYRAQLIP